MTDDEKPDALNDETLFSRQVGAQAMRKLKAKERTEKSIWFGLGMSGLIGWSVTVPALIGVAVGIWLDRRYPSGYSWTLMLMLIGLITGCVNAWHWVNSEFQKMHEDSDE